jgi:hypothetical protein
MDPKYWGKPFWNMLNTIALSYPENADIQTQTNVSSFLLSLKNILPCERCRLHYIENIKKFQISQAVTSRENLIKWVIDIHNEVNKSLNKPVLNYKDALYEMETQIYGTKQLSVKYYIIGGMMGSMFLFWFWRKMK